MDIDRLRVEWSGDMVVGPGVSTFYAVSGDGDVLNNNLAVFFDNISQWFSDGKLSWYFPGAGEVIDSATGQAIGAWSGGAAQTVTASAAEQNFAAGVGARVQWNTGVFHNGRRVRGSTFLVPLIRTAYESDGTIASGAVADINGVCNALLTAVPSMGVHSRPTSAGASDGGFATISSGACSDKVSWLRSRKI